MSASGITVTRDDGSVVSIPQSTIEAMPHTALLGIYVKAASYADGAWAEDLCGMRDRPIDITRTVRDMESAGLLRSADSPDPSGRGDTVEVFHAVGVEVIA